MMLPNVDYVRCAEKDCARGNCVLGLYLELREALDCVDTTCLLDLCLWRQEQRNGKEFQRFERVWKSPNGT